MARLLSSTLLAAACATAVPAQEAYWLSARGTGGVTPHRIHLFDGPTHLASVDQAPGAQASAWGYRDGATDRSGYIYFGWESGVRRHDAVTGALDETFAIDGGAPVVGSWRALAFDPTGDNGRGSLWVAATISPLVETDLNGTLLQQFANSHGWALIGLAYDDVDGNLWGLDALTFDVIKIDTTNGSVSPGWPNGCPGAVAQLGLSGLHGPAARVGSNCWGSAWTIVYTPYGGQGYLWDVPAVGQQGLAFVPREAFAQDLEVIFGAHQSGGVDELRRSDDAYVLIEQRAAVSVLLPSILVQIGAVTLHEIGETLEVAIETGTNARPDQPRQVLALLDHRLGVWEVVDERPATLEDMLVEVVIDDEPQRFAQPGTGRLRMRLDWFDPGNVLFAAWGVRVDRARWLVPG